MKNNKLPRSFATRKFISVLIMSIEPIDKIVSVTDVVNIGYLRIDYVNKIFYHKIKNPSNEGLNLSWALRDSNPGPSACKADALNQLS